MNINIYQYTPSFGMKVGVGRFLSDYINERSDTPEDAEYLLNLAHNAKRTLTAETYGDNGTGLALLDIFREGGFGIKVISTQIQIALNKPNKFVFIKDYANTFT